MFLPYSVCFVFIFSSTQGEELFFREDYKYIEPFESFYRINMQHRTWLDAEGICFGEKAYLLHPKDIGETLELIAVLSILNGTQSVEAKSNGLSNVITEDINKTFDGIPISELYTNWGPYPNETNKYPFICKKSRLPISKRQCNIPIPGYTYTEDLVGCYKFHIDPKSWTEAADICNREQSHLAVINSDEEARALVKLTEQAPKDSVMGNYLRGIAHLGFRKDNEDWKILDGTKLEDSGYPSWGYGQPDGPDSGEFCGSMFYGGELNDIGCHVSAFFICEHDIRTFHR